MKWSIGIWRCKANRGASPKKRRQKILTVNQPQGEQHAARRYFIQQ
jgi:hypothetical protein